MEHDKGWFLVGAFLLGVQVTTFAFCFYMAVGA